VTKIFARGSKDFGHTIDDISMSLPLEFRRWTAETRVPLVRKAEIAMPCRLAKGASRGVDARPGHHAFIDRLLQAEDIATHVAHHRDPAHQVALGVLGLVDEVVAGIPDEHLRLGKRAKSEVDMRVGEARHQRASAAGDDRSSRSRPV
jgi:hypothetical protein